MRNKSLGPEAELFLVNALVLLQRQALLAEQLVSVGSVTLTNFEAAVADGVHSISHVLDVFNYCWALVDQLERYRKVASSVPSLSKKSAEFRALEAGLSPLTKIRNQFQHINNHIRNSNSGPLLGSVCWARGNALYMASLPDVGPARSVPSISFDTRTGVFVSEFCYVYNDDLYDLGVALAAMRSFQKYVDQTGEVKVDGVSFRQEAHFIATRFEYVVTPASS